MTVVKSVADVRKAVKAARAKGLNIGFVPTMGALHEGHASLVRHSTKECGYTVVSIYVNPTQFGAGEDFDKYPRTLDADTKLVDKAGGSLIFAPTDREMYPNYRGADGTWVDLVGLTKQLEGASRPHHFRGVTTVVTKLFNIVQPDKAYFGQKDFQQCRVIQRMAADLDMPLEVVMCQTVREANGLAMSSRNVYLNPEQRKQALCLSQTLTKARELYARGERNAEKISAAMRELIASHPLARIDYVEIVDHDTLASVAEINESSVAVLAVFVGTTRLIDNGYLK
ncbi:MAG: pantoate--beta-alanine ligase [Planctomycetes bacterium]|nr:pantoate--beta-alanine ligase [Planctomycetota bacterium]NUQ34750.1 pantoate--beta-alanine ligase [Planctomycetaceae bacterium]